MGFSIPEELRVLGVTSRDFEKKRRSLTKSLKSEVGENKVFCELYKDLLKKAYNLEILQMIYWNMAVFKDKIGQNSFEYQQKSQQSRLLNLREQGKTKVKINADCCSASCKKLHNLVVPISKALKKLPIPNPKCETKLNSDYTLCKSIYLVAKDSEEISIQLPSTVIEVPEITDLMSFFNEKKEESSLFFECRNKNSSWKSILDWVIPIFAFFSGLIMFFYSPITSFILIFWSLVFSPPIIRASRKFIPFFKTKFGILKIFLIGLLIIFLPHLISIFVGIGTNQFHQKSTIPYFEILSIEDKSIGSRSKLFVSIEASEVKNYRERALVVMEAAKQIFATKFYDELNKIKYDYIFVTLQMNKKNSDQSYIFAEAEFAPDGGGLGGLEGNNEKKWRWNVRSSNIRINDNNPESLQKVKGTLKTFLIR